MVGNVRRLQGQPRTTGAAPNCFMASEKQSSANQRNAQNSSGPSSVEGKAASRMNALKTGLYAKSAVIRGEAKEDFDELVQQYNDQYHPVTPQARTLVDSLIRNTWLLRRYDRIEGELWEAKFRKIDDFRHTDKRLPTGLAFEMAGDYERLRKCVDTAERSLVRTLNKLEKLTEHFVAQALVPAASTLMSTPGEPPVLPQSPEPAARAIPEIGFVPSAAPEPPVEAPKPPLEDAL